MIVEGDDDLVRPLLRESGGHRWQRVPPTERRGRVHTSTVTVAAFELREQASYKLKEADIEIFTTMGSGPGGQHRNKTESVVVMRHTPTGIEARAAAKSQQRNRITARAVLEARVAAHFEGEAGASEAADRRAKVGSGMRGDKVRTYREQDNQVTDHRSERKARLGDVRAGKLESLR